MGVGWAWRSQLKVSCSVKPPVPLSSSLITLVSALCVAALLLPLGDPPGDTPGAPAGEFAAAALPAAAPSPPDAGWRERDYLLHYAQVICLRAAYGGLDPAPSQVLEALDAEGWAMVELSHQQPGVYDAIHKKAWAAGGDQAPARALAGCKAWVTGTTGGILNSALRAD